MKAKRGDSIAIVRTTRDFYIGKPSETRTEIELGEITGITREGVARMWRPYRSGSPRSLANEFGVDRWFIIPASQVAPADVERVAEANVWHQGSPFKPFESVAQVRDALRPHLIGGGAESA